MTMTSEAKRALSTTIRSLRQRLLDDLKDATESAYRLSVRARDAGLDEASKTKRKRLETWIDEQVRAQPAGAHNRNRDAFLREAEQQAAYTLLNRLVILRLMEEPGTDGVPLRRPALIKGGWDSRGYQDFRELARALVRDEATEGYAFLLQLVFEELAEDLPGLFGSAGIADLIPTPPATLRQVVEELNKEELQSCWGDDMTLGWIYQYWNDPERERLDTKINDGGKIEPFEIASKTQMFTERYMVDWMLQNSLGLMWFTLCEKHGWIPEAQTNGTLQRLEERRIAWRAQRAAGEVSLTALMPLETDEEKRWAYFLPDQEIPAEAVELAPDSIRDWKILDPAVGSGHFLVVALGLLLALFREEARHRGEQEHLEWSDQAIVEHLLAHTLHGIDIDPRAVQIAAASLWLKAKGICPELQPEQLNLVAPNLRLADLPEDDPALVELRDDIAAETDISAEFTHQILQALQGADHLGSLLKIDKAVDAAIEQQEIRLRAQSAKTQQVQPDLFGGAPPVQAEMDFSADEARTDLQELLEQFLTRHSSANDLGLRLHGEQLAAGVRFVRMLKEGSYHLVIANPPYQGMGKMASTSYVERHYPLGKADLYAAFLLRGLELLTAGGFSAMLTIRNWMFLKQFADLREQLLEEHTLCNIGDFDRGAFEGIPDEVVSVCASVLRRQHPSATSISLALCPTPRGDTSRDSERTARKRAATLTQEGMYWYQAADLKVVPEWPLVYWWEDSLIEIFQRFPRIAQLAEVRQGMASGDNARFLRLPHEVLTPSVRSFSESLSTSQDEACNWAPYIKGSSGKEWIEPLEDLINWRLTGAELAFSPAARFGRAGDCYFKPGVAFSMIGSSFMARSHRYRSVIGDKGSSVYPASQAATVCSMNTTTSRIILQSLNPSISFQVGDVNRLPLFTIAAAEQIYLDLDRAFTKHESCREISVEFKCPGPSPWRHAQEWAQLAVDRPEGAPLPDYTEELDPEAPTNHLSFALGVALGRFAPVDEHGRPTTSNPAGILDPTSADLHHTLPAGILFLDGSLAESDQRDSLGHPATQPLHQAWANYGSAIGTTRATGTLRDWLRLNFFKDVHKSMYENRPIHWPLSSASKTFVAWINIHRWNRQTLRELLAEHLIPTRTRLDGELDDLRKTRAGADAGASREADDRIGKLSQWREELQTFIEAVQQCADHGPPATDGRCPERDHDSPYEPDLDDGVMINSAAIWPLLDPQWRDTKKWWKELASAQGKKDYDWSHLAMRYWPDRVDEKCQQDPSLGVAHGCFWRYHPERAWAWELRLQQEIGPDFRIEEAPYRPGGRDLGDEGDGPHRSAWLADHPSEALAAVEKEAIRRMGRGDNRQAVNEMRLLERGLWSVIPERVSALELRLSERQGEAFSLRAPDEAEGRAAIGEQVLQVGLALASVTPQDLNA